MVLEQWMKTCENSDNILLAPNVDQRVPRPDTKQLVLGAIAGKWARVAINRRNVGELGTFQTATIGHTAQQIWPGDKLRTIPVDRQEGFSFATILREEMISRRMIEVVRDCREPFRPFGARCLNQLYVVR